MGPIAPHKRPRSLGEATTPGLSSAPFRYRVFMFTRCAPSRAVEQRCGSLPRRCRGNGIVSDRHAPNAAMVSSYPTTFSANQALPPAPPRRSRRRWPARRRRFQVSRRASDQRDLPFRCASVDDDHGRFSSAAISLRTRRAASNPCECHGRPKNTETLASAPWPAVGPEHAPSTQASPVFLGKRIERR